MVFLALLLIFVFLVFGVVCLYFGFKDPNQGAERFVVMGFGVFFLVLGTFMLCMVYGEFFN